ncbi:serine/threonine-protein kinase [Actinomadura algeriensis]|uniref:non-specific serine/threonine protein kinase n=1 Tax=Actinomadura algeriensis TaxID=1679523 RepID=A0ABR9JPW0_9ACTN|nr:serine/threonine-protein kinase [Actinomadura algeriensis]MBE1532601.1 non-specific serine/threonine protein kinase [Actinomadura algeriensis]
MRTIADRYRVTSAIGRGGMGEVWGGTDLRLNRPVAIKLLRVPEDAPARDVRRRFHREARITARLRHPGVPVVHDFGQDDDLFLVMEELSGDSVGKLADEYGALPAAWAAFIGAQVCAVLAAAHGAGLIHRDVKPENLVLEPDGSVKVIDFGVATSTGGEFSRITHTGQIPGTARYMAPELLTGGEATRASDLYAVGCLLHELLAGERPFQAPNVVDEIVRSQSEPAPRLSSVPAELADLVRSLLAKDPARRPSGAADLHARLLPWTHGLRPLPGWTTGGLGDDPRHLYTVAVAALRPG